MPVIQWEERMSVGVYLIDEQHRELVGLINAIDHAVDRGAGRDEVSRYIRRFYDYTTTHFKTEESLMDHATYPEYFTQVREHLDCSLKALEFHRRFVEESDFDLKAFLDYIVAWFINHTVGIDQTLADHLLKRGLQDRMR
ncbi:Bacteriohemerythrin [Fundidesulfovibrio magnetotacticus]|uniref:Bacteriohemerythrin n=1 Tax=Fundidesulfovibrio magnetotacticus TaxID=2730080 RepID=A0A6V8LN13_9BACT|nr:bacteriohemerythrin [Fundidesulfovibrio magnetotacticus]GFK93054.1 Bacteriohemerythrin [Fundidesulfovibrio magnetotacticus]